MTPSPSKQLLAKQLLPEQLLQWIEAGHATAIATVLETWGSAPRAVGSQLAIRDDGAFIGSVSGGCIEGDVITRALESIETDRTEISEYGVSDTMAWEVGLACGGKIKVLIEPLSKNGFPVADLIALCAARAEKKSALRQIDLTQFSSKLSLIENTHPDTPLASTIAEVHRSDRSQIIEHAGDKHFLQIFNPPLRLLIIGAVHIAQPLSQMAVVAGYDVTIIDPREAFATPERFPNVEIKHEWPDEAVRALAPDNRTAIVALTHDPKLDDPALLAAFESPCFYIGALGSKKTQASRQQRLTDQGIDVKTYARLHGPIGLPLGGRSPEEIAIAILAQMTQVLRS